MRKSDSEKLDLYSEDLYQAVKGNILNCGFSYVVARLPTEFILTEEYERRYRVLSIHRQRNFDVRPAHRFTVKRVEEPTPAKNNGEYDNEIKDSHSCSEPMKNGIRKLR